MPEARLQRTREAYQESVSDRIIEAVRRMPDGRLQFLLTPEFDALTKRLRESSEKRVYTP
jgi:hypothetical protein